ncbi:hypothetical protein [Bryobacter aggregatus]|uniref:hypothetical protein n=1 Tax=Bryobacter aggregatus TaxID=360054 RepID=UPI0012BA6054|nr:hypothetical protein [Bryobacter aggregatus]
MRCCLVCNGSQFKLESGRRSDFVRQQPSQRFGAAPANDAHDVERSDEKESLYRDRLLEALEVGSSAGAFLQVAEEWNWRQIGGAPEAIFPGNCFEQLEGPQAALRSARKPLAPHGLLVIRVPNAVFYRNWRAHLPQEEPLGFPANLISPVIRFCFEGVARYTASLLADLIREPDHSSLRQQKTTPGWTENLNPWSGLG